ncbi:hypothetical protein BD626DRAFT_512927 [Schizophyllum amplum]|uniref:Uncharacterized protein n=1 Tax=Schizophyllum amplum TaxID=97359 RepID=A0A550BZN3_9AGAR|nr:hypothetical protein BD626DRAFT_512927 [Auriculariopsis ampla]
MAAQRHTLKVPEFSHLEDCGESFVVSPTTVFSFDASTQKVYRIARLVHRDEMYREPLHERYREPLSRMTRRATLEKSRGRCRKALMCELVEKRFHGALATGIRRTQSSAALTRLDVLDELLESVQTPHT